MVDAPGVSFPTSAKSTVLHSSLASTTLTITWTRSRGQAGGGFEPAATDGSHAPFVNFDDVVVQDVGRVNAEVKDLWAGLVPARRTETQSEYTQ